MDRKQTRETSKSIPHVIAYPPVVSVLGHVDHGKTTLLDAIRKTSIASLEKGGITQGIGASQVEVMHEKIKRKITFIDTPGHALFENMRRQGVVASDIVLLVVASDDGMMPQTKESLQKIQEAKIPFIVVLTKIDLENAHIDRVKQQLLAEHVKLEEYGGSIPIVRVSGKTGEGIQELLDIILLVYDLSSIKKDAKGEFYGVIIESKVDRKRGITLSLIVKNGTLSQADTLFTNEREVGKVRALLDTKRHPVVLVLPGDAVEILGSKTVLPTGTIVYNREKIKKDKGRAMSLSPLARRIPSDLSYFLSNASEKDTVKVILKTEGKGALEAIKNALPQKAEIVLEEQGDINISDVLLAKDFNAIILGFNNTIDPSAKILAESEHIIFRVYSVVYELLDELDELVEYKAKQGQEVILGKGNIVQSFIGAHNTKILGVKVIEGRIALSDKIKIMRGNKELGRSRISSLKREKSDVKEVVKGLECGVIISPSIDFTTNDVILSYR